MAWVGKLFLYLVTMIGTIGLTYCMMDFKLKRYPKTIKQENDLFIQSKGGLAPKTRYRRYYGQKDSRREWIVCEWHTHRWWQRSQPRRAHKGRFPCTQCVRPHHIRIWLFHKESKPLRKDQWGTQIHRQKFGR